MKLFKKLCSQNQQRKFNALWARLDELTLKQTAEVAATGDEPIALGPLLTDTPQIVRRSRSAIRSFHSGYVMSQMKNGLCCTTVVGQGME